MRTGVADPLLGLAGRGFGKTRMLNEYIQAQVIAGKVERFLLLGRTDDEVEKIIVRGKNSGLLAIAPPWFKPRAFKGDPKYIQASRTARSAPPRELGAAGL